MTDAHAEHLLVVDDSPTVRKLVELTFRGTSRTIGFAGTGAEAVRIARAKPPRMILLDVVLPDVPALDVCEQLASDPLTKRVPIILMSAKDAAIKRQFAQHASVVDFVQKPFTREALALRVEAALSKADRVGRESLTELSGRWPTTAVCSMIGASARTGELVFHTPSGCVLVYWSCGEIVFVCSFDPRDYGLADAAGERTQRDTGKPVPITLAERGALPEDYDIARVIVAVGRRLLSAVLAAGALEFEWREQEALPEHVFAYGRTLPISPKAIAYGAEHTWPSGQEVFKHSPALAKNIEELALTVREQRVLGLIDGSMPLVSVAAHAGLDPRYVRQVASSFTTLGLIEREI